MGVGLGLVWVGYTLAYFGVCSLRGPGVGLLDLVIPGRTVVIPSGGSTNDSAIGATGGGVGGLTHKGNEGFAPGATYDPKTGLLNPGNGQPPLHTYPGPHGSVDFSPPQPVGPGGGQA